jgi:hypothetical protein
LRMSMGGGPLEWPPTRAPHAAMLPARADRGVMRPLFLPCMCRLLAHGADAASRAAWLPVWATPVTRCPRRSMPLLGDARLHRHACWGVSNAHPVPKNRDGQSPSLRLRCPPDGQRVRAAPTRASVGPRADQNATVRGDAERRYGHLSCVYGERRGKP